MAPRRLLIMALSASIGTGACTSPGDRQEESLRRAEEAATNGDLGRAVEILRVAHGFDPRNRLVVTRLAQVYEESHEYWEALSLVESFPDGDHEPRWINLRARLLLRCGQIRKGARLSAFLERKGEAEEATLEALGDIVVQGGLGPQHMDDLSGSWVRRLGERLLDAGETDAALSWLQRLPPITGLEEDMLAQRLVELALVSDDRGLVRRIDRILAEDDSPLGLLVHRRLLILAENHAEVARLDRRFLRSFPEDPRSGDILESEGRRHLARGNLEQALRHADQALALDGSRVGALIVRGLALEWLGQVEEGRAALRTALALEPDNQVARDALGSTHNPEFLIMRMEAFER